MLRTTLLVLLVAFTSVAAAQVPAMPKKTGKKIENPAFKQWSAYKPGTFVTMKMVSEFSGQKSETEMTTTLKSVTKEKIVLSVKTTIHVAGQKIEQVHEPMMDEYETVKGDGPEPEVETSKESVTVGKKKVDCKKTKTTTNFQGQETVTTVWTSDEIPGTMVKSVSKMSMGTTTMTVVAFEAKK